MHHWEVRDRWWEANTISDRWENLREDVFSATFCRTGHHCRPRNRVRKFDGGKCPELCRNCRLIVGNWRDKP